MEANIVPRLGQLVPIPVTPNTENKDSNFNPQRKHRHYKLAYDIVSKNRINPENLRPVRQKQSTHVVQR